MVLRSGRFRLQIDGALTGQVGGTGPPLVLIHGWALDRRMWQPQGRALRRHFRTVMYDRRGFGASTCHADASREIEDLDRLFAELSIRRAALLGMSQGGRIALRYALERPAAVSALVLQGAPYEPTPPPAGDPAYVPLEIYAELVQAGRLVEVHRALARHPLMDVPESAPRARATLLKMIAAYRGEDLERAMTAGTARSFPDLRPLLARIDVPALVLTGDAEVPWLVAAADNLAAALPHAERIVVRGGGHLVNMTAPGAYNRAVLNWLQARAALA